MVDYGLITKNEYGNVQIDSMFQNFILQSSGSVNIYNPILPLTETLSSVAIPASTAPPLIAIRPSSNCYTSMFGYGMTNGLYNSMKILIGNAPFTSLGGSISTTIDYIIGRTISSTPSGTYGMAVYNPNGEVCFHSSYKYLKILSVHNFIFPEPIPSGNYYPYVDVQHPGIYNPYYVLMPSWSGWGVEQLLIPPPRPQFRIVYMSLGLKKLSSESVRIGIFIYSYRTLPNTVITLFYENPISLLVCTV